MGCGTVTVMSHGGRMWQKWDGGLGNIVLGMGACLSVNVEAGISNIALQAIAAQYVWSYGPIAQRALIIWLKSHKLYYNKSG